MEHLFSATTWKPFRMDEIFTFSKGKRLTKDNMIEGKTNYIGAISDDNGVRQYISEEPTHQGNCITVNYNGSVGEAFYQEQPFWASDDVNVLKLKDYMLNQNIALFLCTLIKHNKFKFSYGRKWTLEKMKESILMLPVCEDNNVDFLFMDSYVGKLILLNNLESKIKTNVSCKNLELDTSNWQEFGIGQLFNCYLAKPYHSEELKAINSSYGAIEYITRTSLNNGLSGTIQKEDDHQVESSNAITVGAEGAKFFYRNTAFICGNKVNVIRHSNLNKFNGLFITTALNRSILKKYSYGRAIVLNKLKSEVVKLPVTLDGSPDWVFMENFIKQLPYSDKI